MYIDVCSRKLWSFPLDTQYQTESIDVYRNLKNELEVYPKRVITDGGPTFGNDFKQYVEYHYDRSLKLTKKIKKPRKTMNCT